MSHYKLAFLGFGNVGKALAELMLRKREDIERQTGTTFAVTGIATGSRGIAIDPDGIDLTRALKILQAGQHISRIGKLPVSNSGDFINVCGADVLYRHENFWRGCQPRSALWDRHCHRHDGGHGYYHYRKYIQASEQSRSRKGSA